MNFFSSHGCLKKLSSRFKGPGVLVSQMKWMPAFQLGKFPAFSFFQDSSSFLSFVQMKSAPCRNIAIWWSGFGGEKKSDETATGTVRKLRGSPLDQSSLSQRVAQLENAARRHSRNSARQRKKNPIKKEGKKCKNAVQDFELFQLFFLQRFRCHHLWSPTLSSSSASCLQTRLFLRTKT